MNTIARMILNEEIDMKTVTNGQVVLARALRAADELKFDSPVLGFGMDPYWANEVSDYSAAALADGYMTLNIADRSTALMESLLEWTKCGWNIFGMTAAERYTGWGDNTETMPIIILQHSTK